MSRKTYDHLRLTAAGESMLQQTNTKYIDLKTGEKTVLTSPVVSL